MEWYWSALILFGLGICLMMLGVPMAKAVWKTLSVGDDQTPALAVAPATRATFASST